MAPSPGSQSLPRNPADADSTTLHRRVCPARPPARRSENSMRMRPDGGYECAGCGAPLDVSEGEKPLAILFAASGKPTVRVLKVNGREIHRCEVLSLLPRTMADRA